MVLLTIPFVPLVLFWRLAERLKSQGHRKDVQSPGFSSCRPSSGQSCVAGARCPIWCGYSGATAYAPFVAKPPCCKPCGFGVAPACVLLESHVQHPLQRVCAPGEHPPGPADGGRQLLRLPRPAREETAGLGSGLHPGWRTDATAIRLRGSGQSAMQSLSDCQSCLSGDPEGWSFPRPWMRGSPFCPMVRLCNCPD